MADPRKVVEETAFPKSQSEVAPPQSSGASATGAAIAAVEGVGAVLGRYRWLICALLFFATTINYVDRQILAAVEKPIGDEFHVSAAATGWLASAFMFAYMVFSPVFGIMADRMRRWAIVGIGVLLWSLASGGSGYTPSATCHSARAGRARARRCRAAIQSR